MGAVIQLPSFSERQWPPLEKEFTKLLLLEGFGSDAAKVICGRLKERFERISNNWEGKKFNFDQEPSQNNVNAINEFMTFIRETQHRAIVELYELEKEIYILRNA